MSFDRSNNLSLKYERFTTTDGKDIGIRKFEFVTRTHFLCWLIDGNERSTVKLDFYLICLWSCYVFIWFVSDHYVFIWFVSDHYVFIWFVSDHYVRRKGFLSQISEIPGSKNIKITLLDLCKNHSLIINLCSENFFSNNTKIPKDTK